MDVHQNFSPFEAGRSSLPAWYTNWKDSSSERVDCSAELSFSSLSESPISPTLMPEKEVIYSVSFFPCCLWCSPAHSLPAPEVPFSKLLALTLFLLQVEETSSAALIQWNRKSQFTSPGCNICFVAIHSVRKKSSSWSVCIWVQR